MSMCIVNIACLWQVLPLHKVCLPTWGQHALHTGSECACAAAVWMWLCWLCLHTYKNTCSYKCLGSNIDEGRSEMCYAWWFAKLRESIGFWMCPLLPNILASSSLSLFADVRSKVLWNHQCLLVLMYKMWAQPFKQHCWFYIAPWATTWSCILASTINLVMNMVWVNRPAEFKHISERRKTNWKGFL